MGHTRSSVAIFAMTADGRPDTLSDKLATSKNNSTRRPRRSNRCCGTGLENGCRSRRPPHNRSRTHAPTPASNPASPALTAPRLAHTSPTTSRDADAASARKGGRSASRLPAGDRYGRRPQRPIVGRHQEKAQIEAGSSKGRMKSHGPVLRLWPSRPPRRQLRASDRLQHPLSCHAGPVSPLNAVCLDRIRTWF
jgi:hypothetical protein